MPKEQDNNIISSSNSSELSAVKDDIERNKNIQQAELVTSLDNKSSTCFGLLSNCFSFFGSKEKSIPDVEQGYDEGNHIARKSHYTQTEQSNLSPTYTAYCIPDTINKRAFVSGSVTLFLALTAEAAALYKFLGFIESLSTGGVIGLGFGIAGLQIIGFSSGFFADLAISKALDNCQSPQNRYLQI